MAPTDSDLIELFAAETLKEPALFKLESTLEEINVDSVDMVSVFFALEDKYDVRVEYEEVSRQQTVAQVLALVHSKIKSKALT
jgi:acyl carrier protein